MPTREELHFQLASFGISSYFGGTTVPPYTAAKHAVAGLTKALSNDWAGRGICVNAIAPGYIATALNTALIGNPDRVDKLLRKIGLSGRSIVPMLIGFGCTVPGVMASRTLPSDRDRKMTILLTPFMSCSAKLPIYGFFTVAFFPKYSGLVMVGLYFFGIAVGILAALLFKNTLFRGEAVPFVMELPNYRMPGLKNVGQLLWDKAKDFLQRAFTVIFLATIIIWFLQTFDLCNPCR